MDEMSVIWQLHHNQSCLCRQLLTCLLSAFSEALATQPTNQSWQHQAAARSTAQRMHELQDNLSMQPHGSTRSRMGWLCRGLLGAEQQATWPSRTTAVHRALPPSEQIQKEPRDAQVATGRLFQSLLRRQHMINIFPCYSPHPHCLSSLPMLQECSPTDWSPMGFGGKREGSWINISSWLLKEESLCDLFCSRSQTFSPSQCSSCKEEARLVWAIFHWAFGFPSACISTEMVEVLFVLSQAH